MPIIAHFYGIKVAIFYDDHQPAHFHAYYAEFEIVVDIHELTVTRGEFPPRASQLTLEWAELCRENLLQNWQRAAEHRKLLTIPPLQ